MRIFKTHKILEDLKYKIKYKNPFSIIRFGDGGLKFIDSILNNKKHKLKLISQKEGIEEDRIIELFYLWGYYARRANYIDCPEVYFSDNFWERRNEKKNKYLSKSTLKLLQNWKYFYIQAEFDNYNFCNPELNFLSLINFSDRPNLYTILKNKKVCIIGVYDQIEEIFKNKITKDIFFLKIEGHENQQMKNSYKKVLQFIEENAYKFDVFLVSAGEVGRVYSGKIKEFGGRSFDFGFALEYVCFKKIPDRLLKFLKPALTNNIELELKKNGLKYIDSL